MSSMFPLNARMQFDSRMIGTSVRWMSLAASASADPVRIKPLRDMSSPGIDWINSEVLYSAGSNRSPSINLPLQGSLKGRVSRSTNGVLGEFMIPVARFQIFCDHLTSATKDDRRVL
uniref:Uncharacterized protein n=1 Tax=Encephalitozoon cuniculi TaxID=6035 RepID=M1KJD3_ENCCN|nr:hypothetical protein ECU04_0390 [Encephalitozoon cuniculi]